MATKTDSPTTVESGITVDQAASQALQADIASLDKNDPNVGFKILQSFSNYARVTGRQKLLDNVNDVLKKAQDGKIDLRKKFADIAPDIIKAASTKEIEVEGGNFEKYFQTLYGQQTKRGDNAQALVNETLSGITSGYKMIGWIGAVLSAIPGCENVGKSLIETAKEGSLSAAKSLPNTAEDINKSAMPIKIQPATMKDGRTLAGFLENSLGMFGANRVVAEAEELAATRDAPSAASGNKAKQAFSSTATNQGPKDTTTSKPAICATELGAGLDICKAPSRAPTPMGTQTN